MLKMGKIFVTSSVLVYTGANFALKTQKLQTKFGPVPVIQAASEPPLLLVTIYSPPFDCHLICSVLCEYHSRQL